METIVLWLLFAGCMLAGFGIIFDYFSSSNQRRRSSTDQIKFWLWIILIGLILVGLFTCFQISANHLLKFERQNPGSVRFWFGLSIYPSLLTAALGYIGVRIFCRSLIAAILSLTSSAVGWLFSSTVSLALLFLWGESASEVQSSSSGSGLSDFATGLLIILAWVTFVAVSTGLGSWLIVIARILRR